MTPERWARIEEVFGEALEKPVEERAAFVASIEDEQLRQDVERLLAEEKNPSFRSPLVPSELVCGEMLGHYRLEAKLGEGGMGAVYRAYDTRLRRQVALKVFPPERFADPEHRRRFLGEARAASALNYPNVVAVYEIGSHSGIDFIAMEYVPGKTLAELIGRKGLPLRKALEYAVQVASALAAAHCAATVHRDLKPANIMINNAGQVKVMDFGLAKRTERAGEAGFTQTAPLETETGTIVGTVAYMSPEQAEGKKVDARSDIFSFGAVLYEMVTGRRAFQRDSTASTLAAILKEEPKAAGEVVHGMPLELEKILIRCLRKNPAQRFQYMADVKVELEELRQAPEAVEPPALERRRRWVVPAGLAVALAATMAGIWAVRFKTGTPEAEPVAVPPTTYPGIESFPSFSPDGTQVAFQWCPEEPGETCQIYVKQIGVEPPFQLTNDRAPSGSPAWSPDGRTIAFERWLSPSRTALVLIPQRGGRERVLAELDVSERIQIPGPYLAWTPDSKWLACSATERGNCTFFLVSVETGERRTLATYEEGATGKPRLSTPAFSPDGRSLAFTRRLGLNTDVCLFRLGEGYLPQGEPERIASANLSNTGAAWTADGSEIVFASGPRVDRGLWRVAVSRSAKPRRLAFAWDNGYQPAVSRQGNRLAYVVEKFDSNIWRVDLDGVSQKVGVPVKLISSTTSEVTPAYSPDGKRIAFVSGRSGADEVWVCESDGSNPVQLTSFGGGKIYGPRWSPAGDSIAFQASPRGDWDLYAISANGGAHRRLTTGRGQEKWPYWSRDGKWLYFSVIPGGQIWKIPSSGGEAVQIARDPVPNPDSDVPEESPDGKWLYYQRGWPRPLSGWRMPVEGGEKIKVLDSVHPYGQWTVGKKGLYFFLTPDQQGHSSLCLHEFTTGKTRKLATIERPVWLRVAVSPDGRTLLYSQLDETGSDLMLVENFQ